MAIRISKIYTRTGDNGTTGLADGSRLSKDAERIEASGSLDELNCALGVLLTHELPDTIRTCLNGIQQSVSDIGQELRIPGHYILDGRAVKELEDTLDGLCWKLPHVDQVILPGGSPAAAACHMARGICRRAERRFIGLAQEEEVNPTSASYLNRLSDLLFLMARSLNQAAGVGDVLGQPVGQPNQ